MLDVCLPGTGGVVPRLDRFLSCCYLRYEGVGLLIDCGEGTQLSVKKAGFTLGKISILLLTHYHADHVSGLPSGDEHGVSGAQKDGEAQRGQNGLTNELEHDVYPYVKKKPEGTHAEETSGVGEERTPLQVICTDAARRGRRRKSRYQ